MIEVLFGESEAQFMKITKENGFSDCDKNKVICLALMLDIGDIREKIDSQYRNNLIFNMYTQNCFDNSEGTLNKLRNIGKQYVN